MQQEGLNRSQSVWGGMMKNSIRHQLLSTSCTCTHTHRETQCLMVLLRDHVEHGRSVLETVSGNPGAMEKPGISL